MIYFTCFAPMWFIYYIRLHLIQSFFPLSIYVYMICLYLISQIFFFVCFYKSFSPHDSFLHDSRHMIHLSHFTVIYLFPSNSPRRIIFTRDSFTHDSFINFSLIDLFSHELIFHVLFFMLYFASTVKCSCSWFIYSA